jgi:hypothetical protein
VGVLSEKKKIPFRLSEEFELPIRELAEPWRSSDCRYRPRWELVAGMKYQKGQAFVQVFS